MFRFCKACVDGLVKIAIDSDTDPICPACRKAFRKSAVRRSRETDKAIQATTTRCSGCRKNVSLSHCVKLLAAHVCSGVVSILNFWKYLENMLWRIKLIVLWQQCQVHVYISFRFNHLSLNWFYNFFREAFYEYYYWNFVANLPRGPAHVSNISRISGRFYHLVNSNISDIGIKENLVR